MPHETGLITKNVFKWSILPKTKIISDEGGAFCGLKDVTHPETGKSMEWSHGTCCHKGQVSANFRFLLLIFWFFWWKFFFFCDTYFFFFWWNFWWNFSVSVFLQHRSAFVVRLMLLSKKISQKPHINFFSRFFGRLLHEIQRWAHKYPHKWSWRCVRRAQSMEKRNKHMGIDEENFYSHYGHYHAWYNFGGEDDASTFFIWWFFFLWIFCSFFWGGLQAEKPHIRKNPHMRGSCWMLM